MKNEISISDEVDKFFDDSSIATNKPPKFILITGIVAAGKTTMRRREYHKGYVNIDAGDIFVNLSKGQWYKFPDAFEGAMEIIGSLIIHKALKEKRNVVMEIIGESFEDSKTIIDTMSAYGYKTHLTFLECDPVEAYKRHIDAATSKVDYIPCLYAQTLHKKWLLDAAKEK